jgi:NDP-sugar pyrophosphorylase family protein
MKPQVIIPMSGIGKRFIDAGYEVPKPLIKVGGKTIIQHVLEMFPNIDDPLLIVNEDHLSNPSLDLANIILETKPNAIIYPIREHKLGPGWAVLQAKTLIDPVRPVIVNYCDFGWLWNFDEFTRKLSSGIDGLIATYHGFHPHMLRNNKYAYVRKNSEGRVIDIREKEPFTAEPMKEEASSGTYGFASGKLLLEMLNEQIERGISFNGEFYMSLTYSPMIEAGFDIETFEIEKFLQWGTPEDLADFLLWVKFFSQSGNRKSSLTGVNNIVLLAAGAGRRFVENGYKVFKPFLEINHSYLCGESLRALGGTVLQNREIVFQSIFDIPKTLSRQLDLEEVKIFQIEKLTKGQAETALLALKGSPDGVTIVATCDSLLFPEEIDYRIFDDRAMGVWTAEPSIMARTNPNQFGWVKSDVDGRIEEILVKQAPPDGKGWKVITGTFIFGSAMGAANLIEHFLQDGEMVNNEFYLDTLLTYALSNSWTILSLNTRLFVSIGTPAEYETYRYWEAFFISNPFFLDSSML